jgi:quercetin dioxygenase-like cupin family protein
MRVIRIQDAEDYNPARFIARPFIEGDHANVRLIRLAPGQALPPHRHNSSDLFLYVAEGTGELETSAGVVPFAAGALAHYRGEEELHVRNCGPAGMTLLAFLAPKFATT